MPDCARSQKRPGPRVCAGSWLLAGAGAAGTAPTAAPRPLHTAPALLTEIKSSALNLLIYLEQNERGVVCGSAQNKHCGPAVCLELGSFPAVSFGFRAGAEGPGLWVCVSVGTELWLPALLAWHQAGSAPRCPTQLLGGITWQGGGCGVLSRTHSDTGDCETSVE